AGAALAAFIQNIGARGNQPPSNSAAAAGIGALVLIVGFVLILGVIMLTEYVLQIIGGVMCLSAGTESGAKGMGIGMLVCTLLVGFLYVVQQADQQVLQSGIIGLVAGLAMYGAWIVEMVLFILYLRQIANFMQSEELRKKTVSLAIWYGIWVGDMVVNFCAIIGLAIALGAAVF